MYLKNKKHIRSPSPLSSCETLQIFVVAFLALNIGGLIIVTPIKWQAMEYH